MSVWALIPAAGKGTRAHLGVNKAFYPLNGRMMLLRTLDAFENSGLVSGCVVVLSKDEREAFYDIVAREKYTMSLLTAEGGDTRQQSVLNGLLCLPDDVREVLIHDAARPCVRRETIASVLESVRKTGSGVPCTAVTDTVKLIGEDGSVSTPDRSRLRAVQTPQGFLKREILDCHERAEREGFTGTDDASLYERYYGSVTLVDDPFGRENKKYTMAEDFISRIPQMRVGHGYDAHRLVEDRELVLCGVRVPYEKGLFGHSDADVPVHALMDAILGAVGENDIGAFFPDSDPAYKGISSVWLLKEVMKTIGDKGWQLVNADITIVAQRPKLRPFIDEMRQCLRDATGCDNVNVKATTTEGMGFEGEGKGISATAVVLVVKT